MAEIQMSRTEVRIMYSVPPPNNGETKPDQIEQKEHVILPYVIQQTAITASFTPWLNNNPCENTLDCDVSDEGLTLSAWLKDKQKGRGINRQDTVTGDCC